MAKLTVGEQLREAQAKVAGQANEIDALRKELANNKNTIDYMSRNNSEMREQIELVHTILDALPNPPARKYGEYNAEHKIAVRLCVLLAARNAS